MPVLEGVQFGPHYLAGLECPLLVGWNWSTNTKHARSNLGGWRWAPDACAFVQKLDQDLRHCAPVRSGGSV